MKVMDSQLFMQWHVFNSIEPPLEQKLEIHLTRLLYHVLQMVSKEKLSMDKLMIDWWKEPETTAARAAAILKQLRGIKGVTFHGE